MLLAACSGSSSDNGGGPLSCPTAGTAPVKPGHSYAANDPSRPQPTGGTILDGTYYRTDTSYYTGAASASGQFQGVVIISGTQVAHYNNDFDDPATAQVGTFTVSGNKITETLTNGCGSTSAPAGTQQQVYYSAIAASGSAPATLLMWDPDHANNDKVITYTMQAGSGGTDGGTGGRDGGTAETDAGSATAGACYSANAGLCYVGSCYTQGNCGATWQSDGCPATNRFGRCAIPGGCKGGYTLSIYPPYEDSVEKAQTLCRVQGGTWTPE